MPGYKLCFHRNHPPKQTESAAGEARASPTDGTEPCLGGAGCHPPLSPLTLPVQPIPPYKGLCH